MYQIFYHGNLIARFEEREHTHRYVHGLKMPVKVIGPDGQPVEFVGRPPTETALRLKEIMRERGCTLPQARSVLQRERDRGGEPAQAPGRPRTERNARVWEIMKERSCSYACAYQQARREAKNPIQRGPGRVSARERALELVIRQSGAEETRARREFAQAYDAASSSLAEDLRLKVAVRVAMHKLTVKEAVNVLGSAKGVAAAPDGDGDRVGRIEEEAQAPLEHAAEGDVIDQEPEAQVP